MRRAQSVAASVAVVAQHQLTVLQVRLQRGICSSLGTVALHQVCRQLTRDSGASVGNSMTHTISHG